MPYIPRDLSMDSAEVREHEYWRSIVKRELMASSAASELRASTIEILAYRIATAIQADLASTRPAPLPIEALPRQAR